MNRANLGERLREIIGARPVEPGPAAQAPLAPGVIRNRRISPDAEHALGGRWDRQSGLSCFVVERRLEPNMEHGDERLEIVAARLADSSKHAALVTDGSPAHAPFVFFDLETTGLSGGAGTYVFLVGCGVFDDQGGFRTRQYLLLRHGDERQLLQVVARDLSEAGVLVTFNGKSFDAPIIEMRCSYHRLEWTGGRLPHLDVLHAARRFWHDTAPDRSCSLSALERLVLGARRAGDVPGAGIPTRYFSFIRSGDARPLAAVLEHNRLDLLSLGCLTSRLLHLVGIGPRAARHAREAAALGRIYARAGLERRAREAYECALELERPCGLAPAEASVGSVRIEAARALALLSRRARRYEDAASYWRSLLEMPCCPPHVAREATEALAIHHEHRAGDLVTARAFALRSLVSLTEANEARKAAWNQAVRHRLARIERKMRDAELTALDSRQPSILGFEG